MGPKILSFVAGLDSQNSLFISKVLFEENFEVTLFQTVLQALNRFKTKQPDTLFIHLNLILENNIQILKELVQLNNSCQIIIIDQHLTAEKIKIALSIGAHNIIEHPLSKIQLGSLARSAAKQARLQTFLFKTVALMYSHYSVIEKALTVENSSDKKENETALNQFRTHFKELVTLQTSITKKPIPNVL